MISNPKLRPNELLYINLGSMKPYFENLDIPKTQLKREKDKIIHENYSSQLPEVVFNENTGKYFIVAGYTTFYAYCEQLNSNVLIPCKAYYSLEEKECYLLTIEWMLRNRIINWYNRHEIITKLIGTYNVKIEELAKFLHVNRNQISLYLNPPLNVRNETRRKEEEKIINKIFLEAFKHDYNKEYLYAHVLYMGYSITQEQLKYISWIRGNGIKFENCNLTLEQEHRLIDIALYLKEDFLNEIRLIINNMRIENEENPIFDW